MNNGQSWAQTAPASVVDQPAETAESLLDKVLAATAQTSRRFSLDEMGDMADTVARSGLYKMTGAQDSWSPCCFATPKDYTRSKP